MMDDENQRRTEELGAKVNRLKHLTLDLDKEAKGQHKLIDDMGFDFGSTSTLIKSGVNRIGTMMSSGKSNRRLMCYMITGIVVGFMILYKLVAFVRT